MSKQANRLSSIIVKFVDRILIRKVNDWTSSALTCWQLIWTAYAVERCRSCSFSKTLLSESKVSILFNIDTWGRNLRLVTWSHQRSQRRRVQYRYKSCCCCYCDCWSDQSTNRFLTLWLGNCFFLLFLADIFSCLTPEDHQSARQFRFPDQFSSCVHLTHVQLSSSSSNRRTEKKRSNETNSLMSWICHPARTASSSWVIGDRFVYMHNDRSLSSHSNTFSSSLGRSVRRYTLLSG